MKNKLNCSNKILKQKKHEILFYRNIFFQNDSEYI